MLTEHIFLKICKSKTFLDVNIVICYGAVLFIETSVMQQV